MAKKTQKSGTCVSGNETHIPNIDEVVAFCESHHLPGKIVGKWVWVFFDEKPDAAMRKVLKDFGFRWSPRRGGWAHNCGHPTRSAHESSPFEKYQVQPIGAVA